MSTSKTGRPRKSGDETKSETYLLRLTPTRKRQLRQLADLAKLSMADYIDRQIKGKWSNKRDEERKAVLEEIRYDISDLIEKILAVQKEEDEILTEIELDEAVMHLQAMSDKVLSVLTKTN